MTPYPKALRRAAFPSPLVTSDLPWLTRMQTCASAFSLAGFESACVSIGWLSSSSVQVGRYPEASGSNSRPGGGAPEGGVSGAPPAGRRCWAASDQPCCALTAALVYVPECTSSGEHSGGSVPVTLALRRRTGLRLLRHRKWNPHTRQLLIPNPGGVRALRADGGWRGGGASLRSPPFVFPISISM